MTTTAPALTSSPLATTAPAWLDRSLFPFASRWVWVGDHRIHYVDEGAGPPLLLVHGSPAWSFQYREVIAQLRRERRCIALDMPGFGLTETAPDLPLSIRMLSDAIEGFVDRLGLDRFDLAVHATGGPPALGMAVRAPERVRRLVVANSFAWPLTRHPSLRRMARVVGSPPFAWAQIYGNLLMRIFAAKGRRTGRFSPAERAALLGPVTLARRRQMQSLLRALTREEDELATIEAGLGRLTDRRALLLFGAEDKGYRAGTCAHWQSLFPRHEAEIYDGAAHFLHEDRPADVATRMARFLEAP